MIIYYTGTGNSRHVASRLGELLSDDVLNLFERIKEGDFSALQSEKPWVVVAPTYSWQVPHLLRDWLLKAELLGSKDIYFVLTCGDSIGNAAKYAKGIADAKAMNFKGLQKVIMPENYIAMFPVPSREKSLRIVEAAEPAIAAIAETIRAGRELNPPVGIFGKLLSGLVNKVFYNHVISDKKFVVGERCTACGLCASMCPLSNISLASGKPVWHGNCTHCMACICHCPEEAIEYGKVSVGKWRYKCPK